MSTTKLKELSEAIAFASGMELSAHEAYDHLYHKISEPGHPPDAAEMFELERLHARWNAHKDMVMVLRSLTNGRNN